MEDTQTSATNADNGTETALATESPIPASSQADSMDSAAESQEVDTSKAPLVPKRGPGRPPAVPTRPVQMVEPDTPSPPFKRYYSDAPNSEQKPVKALKWMKEVPKWAKARMTIYVYRGWPVLKPVERDENGTKKDYGYIDKLGEPPETITELYDRYGCGDYKLMVNDDTHNKRTIMEINVREQYRDLVGKPPTDRRVDDVSNVDLEDPANRGYVHFLKGRGKLPDQNKEKVEMAEATAIGQVTGSLNRVVDRLLDNKNGQQGSDKVVEVLADAAKKGQDFIVDSMRLAQEHASKQPDPMEMLDKVIGVADRMRPKDTGPNPVSDVIDVFKILTSSLNDRVAKAEAQRDQIMMDMMKMLAERANPQPAAAPAGTPSATDDIGGIDRMISLAEKLGWRTKGGGPIAGDGGGGSFDWKSMIPDILQGVGQLADVAVRAYQTKVMADQGMAGRPMPMPAQPQPVMRQQPTATAPNPVPPNSQALPGAPAPEGGEQDDMNFTKFMTEISKPFANFVNRDLGGAAFAQWLIDTYDEGTYAQIKQQGPQILLMVIQQFGPMMDQIRGKEGMLPQFVEDFMNMEKILAEADEEEAGETGQGEGA